MQIEIYGCRLELVQGDVSEQQVDAIVNAANSRLAGGSGVDGAIHARGGPAIIEETRRRYPGGCPTGSAVASGPGELPCRLLIHAVGPIWHGGGQGEPEQLRGAYRKSLELATEHSCESVAFPALSTGAYGYPKSQAANVTLAAILDFLAEHAAPAVVRLVLFTQEDYKLFSAVAKERVDKRKG